MSRAFTILTALLITSAAGVAGYVYYAGDSVPCPLQTVSAISSSSSDADECPLCQAAKKKSCCSGESLAKHIALGGSTKAEPSCCAGEADSMLPTASVIGGAAFHCSATAQPGCCDDVPSVAGLTGLVGAVAAK